MGKAGQDAGRRGTRAIRLEGVREVRVGSRRARLLADRRQWGRTTDLPSSAQAARSLLPASRWAKRAMTRGEGKRMRSAWKGCGKCALAGGVRGCSPTADSGDARQILLPPHRWRVPLLPASRRVPQLRRGEKVAGRPDEGKFTTKCGIFAVPQSPPRFRLHCARRNQPPTKFQIPNMPNAECQIPNFEFWSAGICLCICR
jgi:hypothetical protein